MLRHALISQIVQMLIMELSILQISYSSEMELEDDSPPASSPRMDRLSMRSESPESYIFRTYIFYKRAYSFIKWQKTDILHLTSLGLRKIQKFTCYIGYIGLYRPI